jgi:hypothetical protein
MKQERYVLHLLEDSSIGFNNVTFIGYWTGTKHFGEDICFPGVRSDKHDSRVKVYKSKKHAENAVKKLKDTFTYVKDAEIEILD